MTPNYLVSVNGDDISPTLKADGRLIGLNIDDKSSLEADKLTLTISDHDDSIALPPTGALITAALGFTDQPLVNRGAYNVDSVDYNKNPAVITVRATSADYRASLKQTHEQSYPGMTLGNIAETIAARHNLTLSIDQRLAQISIDHIDQSNESDSHFISRLTAQYNATALFKNETLVIISQDATSTASGQRLPVFNVDITELRDIGYTESNEYARYTGVKAKWGDRDTGKTVVEMAGDAGYTRTLNNTFPNAKEALEAANAQWQKMKRADKKLTLFFSVARLDALPKMAVALTGFKQSIANQQWQTQQVQHSMTERGYIMTVSCNLLVE